MTDYQQSLLERVESSTRRIACSFERLIEIVEIAASGWLNACPPRGDYKPEQNAKERCPAFVPACTPAAGTAPKGGR